MSNIKVTTVKSIAISGNNIKNYQTFKGKYS